MHWGSRVVRYTYSVSSMNALYRARYAFNSMCTHYVCRVRQVHVLRAHMHMHDIVYKYEGVRGVPHPVVCAHTHLSYSYSLEEAFKVLLKTFFHMIKFYMGPYTLTLVTAVV